MLFSTTMSTRLSIVFLFGALTASVGLAGCRRGEPPPDPLKSQREAMERAKDVGKTMQKAVDQEGRKADEEGK